MGNPGAEAWFKRKAEKKAAQKAKSEAKELIVLSTKYQERPIPIEHTPKPNDDPRPFLSLEQTARFIALKLDYEYRPLRAEGLSHDEAEERVFPAAYKHRKDKETKSALKEAKKEREELTVEDGIEAVIE